MSVVTTMNRQETQMLVGTFQNLAKETGFTTTEIAKLSTVYFRQGRALKDVIELTTIAAKAARIAGIGATESANLLTAAVNGFGLAAKEAEAVSDKFAALAASSASSYQELAVGLSKFASQAKVAGLSLDFAMGLLAKGVETTREAPESIGTALKTILARMRELTDLGKTLEDGMDVSRVDTALRQIGVNLKDTNGQFRDMEDVLTEVGNKFSSLNKMQQASVAVALAGTRQQSRLLAIFQDFDRTLELVQTSEESAGATTAQHLKFMEGMEASLTNLRTSYQRFITTITESEVVIGIVRALSSAIDSVTNILNSLGLSGKNAMIVIIGLAGALKGLQVVQKISNTEFGISIGLQKLFVDGKKLSIGYLYSEIAAS
jgi:TP901 family phage tail tape measure protein